MELENKGIRLNKYISDSGICSRREADRYIEAGRVIMNGIVAETGMRVREEDIVFVDGKPISKEKGILFAFYKPRGIVCTTNRKEPDNIVDFLNYEKRIYPIGRLDKDSEGLILLTNQGDIVDKILRGSNQHEKEYVVTVNKKITEAFIKSMAQGVPITVENKNHKEYSVTTKICEVVKIDDFTFKIILTQGFNRQIRKMCAYFQYKVTHLKRIRIMNICLGRLHCGTYRKITEQEKTELFEKIGYEISV